MNKQILIVDDEEDVRAIATLGLQMGAGWNVLTASSGAEGIAIATQHQPDAILLDLMMPDMDGCATLHHLKQNPETQLIPVILMTAKVQASEQHNLHDLKIAAVFTKPFRPLTLAQQIADALAWHDD
ncbi:MULTISPECIES: response regulator [Leptolyngbya]|jgi:CheY-like chemotaxis protein|uniref:Response regulator receiver protein n=2 Tax=Leptolyngbya boryana TaxID=1184 RepID=A0A1Z4JEX4_LEPBY|nr:MULTISPECIES: response regulator [Leptolyngbya]BAY55335.1 response regulator receiver protein [Leptolyngbya boryana NIES-2135]MBD1860002.1 response regulator [Leptolyngbya sp. FACHB-1624]MBD2369416.1 response regulator [Leptolyngbya sp. FACHB-161]MBD2378015.1 response regulator [Leptolyngbya sp. FACHB-238]MBD2402435.1 response regulator [Leptolyngbya sp. FACHB-239]